MSVVLCIAPQLPLAHANQLPLPRLWSAAVLRTQRYIKYTDLYLFTFRCSNCYSMHKQTQYIKTDRQRDRAAFLPVSCKTGLKCRTAYTHCIIDSTDRRFPGDKTTGVKKQAFDYPGSSCCTCSV